MIWAPGPRSPRSAVGSATPCASPAAADVDETGTTPVPVSSTTTPSGSADFTGPVEPLGQVGEAGASIPPASPAPRLRVARLPGGFLVPTAHVHVVGGIGDRTRVYLSGGPQRGARRFLEVAAPMAAVLACLADVT